MRSLYSLHEYIFMLSQGKQLMPNTRPEWIRMDVSVREQHASMLRWLLADGDTPDFTLAQYAELLFAQSEYESVLHRFLSYVVPDPAALRSSDALQWKYTEREDVDDDFEMLRTEEFAALQADESLPLLHREITITVSMDLSRIEGVTAKSVMEGRRRMMADWRFAPPPSGRRELAEAADAAQLLAVEATTPAQVSVSSCPPPLPLEHLP